MKVVGNETSVWEVIARELFKRIAHIKDDVFNVFSSLHVGEVVGESVGGFSLGDFEDFFIWIVNQESCELAVSEATFKGVLVDADGFWPRIICALAEF